MYRIHRARSRSCDECPWKQHSENSHHLLSNHSNHFKVMFIIVDHIKISVNWGVQCVIFPIMFTSHRENTCSRSPYPGLQALFTSTSRSHTPYTAPWRSPLHTATTPIPFISSSNERGTHLLHVVCLLHKHSGRVSLSLSSCNRNTHAPYLTTSPLFPPSFTLRINHTCTSQSTHKEAHTKQTLHVCSTLNRSSSRLSRLPQTPASQHDKTSTNTQQSSSSSATATMQML
jgi:hypothetical protein